MTGKGATFANKLLRLVFQQEPMDGHGDTYYLSLHTADPGSSGSQSTAETTYPGYGRVPIARSSAGFNVIGSTLFLAQVTSFPPGSADSEIGERCTYACIGRDASGDGELLYRGELSQGLATGAGITPQINTMTGFTES